MHTPRYLKTLRLLSVLAVLFVASTLGAAEPLPLLTVVNEDAKRFELSSDDLAKLPRKTVKVADGQNSTAEYQGVLLSDLLTRCGVVLGKELRGPRVASYVLLEAVDGYRVVLAIGEVDPATTDKVVLLADRRNGAELGEKERPFRLVIPDEKRQVRWIRMIKRISVRPASD